MTRKIKMKNKAIINICKKEGKMILLKSEEQQWINTGAAVYQFGLQDISYDEICYLYDINDDQKSKMAHWVSDLPSNYDFADATADETPAEPLETILQFDGRTVQPYATSLGVLCLDLQYLAPFNLKDRREMFIFVRAAKDGLPYFVIKIGLLIRAIIMPYKLRAQDNLFDNLKQIVKTSYIFDEAKQ